jgi:hypothetical protein
VRDGFHKGRERKTGTRDQGPGNRIQGQRGKGGDEGQGYLPDMRVMV